MKFCNACHSSYPDDFTICPRDQAALRTAADLVPGMVIRGKYEILERIGRGGMAAVYRARHRAFGEIVALKVVGAALLEHDDFLKRFRTEAVVTRKLQHPNAVRVEDLDTTEDGRPFIVMEYVEGRNLREVIRQEGPLVVPRALRIVRQVASALAAAHALGITHRDIKPDNILLTRGPDGSEVAKVLDFGIAKVKEGAFDTGAGYSPTQTGMVVGTPQYISPEQAMGKRGDQVDGRADLYSLGVVLYEMVTGRLPFQSDTAMGLILHHLQTAPTPPHEVRPELGIPAALSSVLMKSLQKERDRRFGSAQEMLEALATVPADAPPMPYAYASTSAPAGSSSREAPTPSPPATVRADITDLPTRVFPKTPTDPPSPRPPRRSWRWAWWVAALVLIVPVFRAIRDREAREDTRPTMPEPPESKIERETRQAAADEEEAREAALEMEDERLRSEVDRVLAASPLVRDEGIEAEVDKGTVTLRGQADTVVPVEVAKALIATLPGVVKIVSEVEVKEPRRSADLETPPGAGSVPKPPPPPRHPVIPGFGPPSADSPEGVALKELLETGKNELAKGNAFAAVAAFKAALSLDPTNRAAREGLIRASRSLMKDAHPRRRPDPRSRPSPR